MERLKKCDAGDGTEEGGVLTPWCMRICNHIAKEYHRLGEGSSHDPREFPALQFAVKRGLL